jgi:hypothetical protein
MTYSVIIRGKVYCEAQSFYLKHSLTVGVGNKRHTHISSFGGQSLILYRRLNMYLVAEGIPHTMRMTKAGYSQHLYSVNCAGVKESIGQNSSPAIV